MATPMPVPDLSSADGRSASFMNLLRGAAGGGLWAVFFWLMVLALAGAHWLTPYLPMGDLPQHAAQITLLSSFWEGQPLWADMVGINLRTPYLAAYPLGAVLTFFMPVHHAIALLLTLAYLMTIGMGLRLGRQAGSDPALDFLLLPGFFGAYWVYGGLTFLVTAPLVLLFLQLALPTGPHRAKPLPLLATGIVLFCAHILAFLFALGIAGANIALSRQGWRHKFSVGWPYILLLAPALLYVLGGSEAVAEGVKISFQPLALRVTEFILYPVDGNFSASFLLLLLWLAPLLTASSLNLRHLRYALPFVLLTGFWFVAPSFFYGTNLIYQRFSLFIFPFFLLLFAPPSQPAPTYRTFGRILCLVLCLFFTWGKIREICDFSLQTRTFSQVLTEMRPGLKVFNFNAGCDGANDCNQEYYLPLWYMAEKSGWVDFNYAFFFPQVAAIKDRASYQNLYFYEQSSSNAFPWALLHGRSYDYFLVHGVDNRVAPVMDLLKRNGECQLEETARAGRWHLLERISCTSIRPAGG